jgi:hypothetical protein
VISGLSFDYKSWMVWRANQVVTVVHVQVAGNKNWTTKRTEAQNMIQVPADSGPTYISVCQWW